MASVTHTTGTPATDGTTEHLAGRRVGNSYILIEPIGHGATGTVWRAVDRSTGGPVAVKLLRQDVIRQPKLVTRFVQERAILLMLRHEHIVRVRDLLTVGESLGLVMDLVEGGSLREYLHERGPLPVARAADLLAQVASALAEAHRLNVVHRDLKPDNILVHHDGDRLHSRLTDFGIARVLHAPGLTTPGALMGTPSYLAPEAISGAPPHPAADVYAVGVLLYELIVGWPPYRGGSAAAVMRRHVEDEPRRYPEIPDGAWDVIMACMAKAPDRRPTALDLVERLLDLAGATADQPALALPPEPDPVDPDDDEDQDGSSVHPSALLVHAPLPRRPPNRARAWRWRAAGVVAIVAAAIAVGVPMLGPWQLLGGDPPPSGATHRSGAQPATNAPAAPAVLPGTATTASPSAGASASNALSAGAAVGVSAGPARVHAGARLFGPYQCSEYQSDLGHPVLARPCYATGPGIRLFGHMEAMPGVQADVSLSLQDAVTGETLAGPYTCPAMMFTDVAPEHDCGPFDFDAPHGRRYVVIQSWQYTGRSMLPGGSTKGPEFSW